MYPHASSCILINHHASSCILMHPNASSCILMYPHHSLTDNAADRTNLGASNSGRWRFKARRDEEASCQGTVVACCWCAWCCCCCCCREDEEEDHHEGRKLAATSAALDNTTDPNSNAADRNVMGFCLAASPSAKKIEQKGSCPTTKTLAP